MARRSFYVVEYLPSHTYSRTFATKRAAEKWAKHFARVETTRVLEGGPGGIEVARFGTPHGDCQCSDPECGCNATATGARS